MRWNEMARSREANVMVLAIFTIPVLLILSGLVIDGGILFVRKAQLQSMVDNGASAGISTLTDEMIEIMNQKLAEDPELTEPSNVLSMIDDDDREMLSQSTTPRITALDYIDRNNEKNLELTDVNITYPYNYTQGDTTISIRAEVTTEHTFYFAPVVGINSQEITEYAISSIQIK